MKIIETYSPEETFEAGRRMGEKAKAGEVYCLTWEWGKPYLPRALPGDWEYREP